MKSRIFYTKPSITEREVELATDAARNGWGSHCYEYIERFEAIFKEHLGVGYAIATSSCTGAMHMGLSALEVGPGDEIILADINWIATAAPAVHLGATPVLVDIDPVSWCIDPARAEASITPRTKAIIATHLYGNLCDMDALLDISRRHGIPIIEDAAEAIGSRYRGERAGAMGIFGTLSFHGTKTITTGEGKMFVTNDPTLYERVLTLSNHGRSRTQIKQFWPDMVGFKYKMSNVQAAIGVAQMERVEELVDRKREILHQYKNCLLPSGLVAMNPEPTHVVNGGWMPTVVFEQNAGIRRADALSAFKRDNIDARVFFYPLSHLPMFTKKKDTVVSHDIAARAINVPSYHDLQPVEIKRVCEVILGLAHDR